LAAELKQALPGRIQDVQLIPSSGGVFEIRKGGELVFSKRALGRFPNEGEIVKALQS
jgi:selenoprotein W-related protein